MKGLVSQGGKISQGTLCAFAARWLATTALSLSQPCNAWTQAFKSSPVRVQAGVLDPAKVTRSGMTNACSIAGIMLTTQVRKLHVL